ncbi:hypothetical protein, partial [Bartonella sp. CL63NXGY]|uniref:hypothetical protein n=1 Tax=Bartonella sp. CL63NXGY TaxID=3243538 RepID=UPI0035CE9CAA
MDINREHKTIQGQTTITGHASNAQINIHQRDLTIKSVKVADQAVEFSTNNDENSLTINLPAAGEVTLTIDYSAPLTDTMMGIYPSYYKLNGETKQIIGTQVETAFARRAVPGVDEPEAEATGRLA